MSEGRSSRVSVILHAIDSWMSKAWLAALLTVVSVVALVFTLKAGSSAAVTDLAAIVQVVTLGMVLVVQHTQARDQRITHRKLDELLRASPEAADHMVMLERGGDDELERASQRHRQHSPYP